MIGLIAFMGTLTGRLAVGGGIIATLFASFYIWLWRHDNKVENRVLAKIEQRTSANVEKATNARASVESTPVDKLSDRYRRD